MFPSDWDAPLFEYVTSTDIFPGWSQWWSKSEQHLSKFSGRTKKKQELSGRKQLFVTGADEPRFINSIFSTLYSPLLLLLWPLLASKVKGYSLKVMDGEISKVENTLSLRLIAAMKDSCASAISSVNQKNEEETNGAKIRAANNDSAVISRPTVTQCKLLTPPRHFKPAKRTNFTCKSHRVQSSLTYSSCPVEKMANSGDKMGLLHYSVPHIHLIVSIAIALTANKHNLIAHQLFDGRKTGNLEMVLRWETSLLSFCMRFCFHSSHLSSSPQWLYFSTNSISKYYSQYKIFKQFSESWGGGSFANSRHL